MKKSALVLGCLAVVAAESAAFVYPRMQVPDAPKEKSLYDFKMADIDGKQKNLKDYKGKVVVVVNVASKCGLTPQYEGLQALYSKYQSKGLVVLGMPANDFAGQEPGTNEEIKTFCTGKYNVTFPMFGKITVLGDSMHPLYAWLLNKTDKKPVEWNFAKFLVGKDGQTVSRFSSRTKPDDPAFVAEVEKALGVK